jgi:hypothetical protein
MILFSKPPATRSKVVIVTESKCNTFKIHDNTRDHGMVTRTRKIPDIAVSSFVINMIASDMIIADRYREVTTIAVLYIVLFFLSGLIITVNASIPP